MKAGFEYCKRGEAFYLLFNNGKIGELSECSEIWHTNFPIEELSAQRRAQKLGFMNRQYFTVRYLKILKQQEFQQTIQIWQVEHATQIIQFLLTERSFTAHMERSVGIEALNIATKQR
jgi:hypothetical protein